MKKIFFATAAIILGVTTLAMILLPAHRGTITPAPTSSAPAAATPTHSPAPATHSVPSESHTGIQSDGTCIHCGPGDNICKAPGDCGYGDNPGGCLSCYDQSKVTEEDLFKFNCLTMGNKTCGKGWEYLDNRLMIIMELDPTTYPEEWDQCLINYGDTTYIDCPSGHIYTS